MHTPSLIILATAAVTVDPTAELEKKIRKIKSDLDVLEKKYDKDYGADDIFLSYQGECFESIREKYMLFCEAISYF